MSDPQKIQGIVGVFEKPDALLAVAVRAREAGWKRWDCHSPYPVHGLDEAMGVAGSPIPYIVIAAGFFGAIFAKTMQWWMSARDFPLMVGGKPLFSLPAFAPVTFELFVLFGALATFASIILLGRLLRWHSPLHDAGVMADITSGKFAVFFDARDRLFDAQSVKELLEEYGCGDIRTVEAEHD